LPERIRAVQGSIFQRIRYLSEQYHAQNLVENPPSRFRGRIQPVGSAVPPKDFPTYRGTDWHQRRRGILGLGIRFLFSGCDSRGTTMGFPTAGEIIDLIKKGATIEWQEKVMELRSAAVDQAGVIVQLREEVQTLRARVRQLESGEQCPKCHVGKWLLKQSTPDPVFGEMGLLLREYKCDSCGFSEQHQFDPKKSA
jgi:hypothetical protein